MHFGNSVHCQRFSNIRVSRRLFCRQPQRAPVELGDQSTTDLALDGPRGVAHQPVRAGTGAVEPTQATHAEKFC